MPRNHDFAWALKELKANRSVARVGWNGVGMALYLVPGSVFKVEKGRPLAAHLPVDTVCEYQAHIDLRTAKGTLVPWLASQTDLLAEDWVNAPVKPLSATQPQLPIETKSDLDPPAKPSKMAKAIKRTERRAPAKKPAAKLKQTPQAIIARAVKKPRAKPNGAALPKGA